MTEQEILKKAEDIKFEARLHATKRFARGSVLLQTHGYVDPRVWEERRRTLSERIARINKNLNYTCQE